ncbi:MAG: NRDE family protein [Desulfobacterales bacterium]|nr:NRDE family protein [Desulfobacterales bacterium]
MCLILLSYNTHPVFKLVMAANRDEFSNRPTEPLKIWEDEPRIVAGRDLKGGGTWMGVGPDGRLAAITNYRNPHDLRPQAPTRGTLVTDFLTGVLPARSYLEKLSSSAGDYNGFNLVVYDGEDFCYFSNREGVVRPISPGLHGLSNHLFDTPWPKVTRGLKLFEAATVTDTLSTEAIFDVLSDRELPPDGELPETGVGIEWERRLAPLFIESAIYGTRSSSIVTLSRSGKLEFHERTYTRQSHGDSALQTRRVGFRINRKTAA